VQFKFGCTGDTLPHTLSRFKKKKIACLSCPKILVDLKICD
jgi:hypothetical protein